MLDSIRKNGITLALFAIVTTGITAIVHKVTTPTVTHQMALQQKALLDQVVPPNLYNNALQHNCYLIKDSQLGDKDEHRVYVALQQQQPVAAAIETTAPDGYSGAIKLLVGADFNGKVLGVRVIEHHETPGLGDKIELRISNWITHFTGVTVKGLHDHTFAVKKDGGQFDQFTGATITPRAVVNQTKRTALFLTTLPERLKLLTQCGGSQ